MKKNEQRDKSVKSVRKNLIEICDDKKKIFADKRFMRKELSKKKKNYCRHVFYNEDLRKVYVYNKVIIL